MRLTPSLVLASSFLIGLGLPGCAKALDRSKAKELIAASRSFINAELARYDFVDGAQCFPSDPRQVFFGDSPYAEEDDRRFRIMEKLGLLTLERRPVRDGDECPWNTSRSENIVLTVMLTEESRRASADWKSARVDVMTTGLADRPARYTPPVQNWRDVRRAGNTLFGRIVALGPGATPKQLGTRWWVPLGRREVGEITGVRMIQQGRAEAEFGWHVTLTDLGRAFGLSESNRRGTASFQMYDDGWRLSSISGVD